MISYYIYMEKFKKNLYHLSWKVSIVYNERGNNCDGISDLMVFSCLKEVTQPQETSLIMTVVCQ
jgi:hypothetical protein